MQLVDRRAWVSGGTQGIGLASAIALAEAGASVVIGARDRARLDEALAKLPRPSPSQRHDAVVVDFSDPAQAAAVAADWIKANGAIHVLVNNTGGPPPGPITEATSAGFLAAFTSHVIANQLLAQTVLPGMRAAGYGRIVNVVSTSVKQPIKGLGVSNTTRGAVASWAKTLSSEVARDGITVNNVLPGSTRTPRLEAIIANRAATSGRPVEQVEAEFIAEIPMGRFGRPEEIAAAVLFFASPAAGYVTGVSLAVDGGRTTAL